MGAAPGAYGLEKGNYVINYCRFFYFDGPTADHICTLPRLVDIVSKHAFKSIRRCVEVCQASHQRTGAPFASLAVPPSRLIDIRVENEASSIVNMNRNTFQYATLSYC